MKDFLFSAKTSFIFVGTVIGAGFATGEEIKLYFQNYGIATVIFSASVFSLLFALFLCVGRFGRIEASGAFGKIIKVLRVGVVLISVCAMGAGSEEILYSLFGVRGGGIITLVVSYALIKRGGGWLGLINFIAVPLIVVLVLVIFIRADTGIVISSGFGVTSAIGYACMNIFCAGMTLKDGNRMTVRQIVASTVMTFCMLAILMVCIRLCIGSGASSMPMISVAEEVGIRKIAEVVVYLAIFTTMLGNLSVISDDVKRLLKSDLLSVFFFVAVVILGILIDFSDVVAFGYPVISFFGVSYTIYAVVLFVLRAKFLLNKSNHRVHSTGESTENNGTAHHKVKLKYLTAVNDKVTKPRA